MRECDPRWLDAFSSDVCYAKKVHIFLRVWRITCFGGNDASWQWWELKRELIEVTFDLIAYLGNLHKSPDQKRLIRICQWKAVYAELSAISQLLEPICQTNVSATSRWFFYLKRSQPQTHTSQIPPQNFTSLNAMAYHCCAALEVKTYDLWKMQANLITQSIY